MFALYIHWMCCKLELNTLNNRKTTASFQNRQKRHVCSNPCICTTQQYSGFFSEVLHNIHYESDVIVRKSSIVEVNAQYRVQFTRCLGGRSSPNRASGRMFPNPPYYISKSNWFIEVISKPLESHWMPYSKKGRICTPSKSPMRGCCYPLCYLGKTK